MSGGRWLARTALIAAAGCAAVLHAQPAVNPTAAAVHVFQQRVADYMKVHRQAEGKVPDLKETAVPQKIATREKALGDTIRNIVPTPKPGDIFAEEFRAAPFKSFTTTSRRGGSGPPRASYRGAAGEVPAVDRMTYRQRRRWSPCQPSCCGCCRNFLRSSNIGSLAATCSCAT